MNVAKVVIKDAAVAQRRVGDNVFESQTGFLVCSEDESLKIEISLPRDAAGRSVQYAPGVYFIGGASFDRDQYGRPTFGKRGLHLIPVPAKG